MNVLKVCFLFILFINTSCSTIKVERLSTLDGDKKAVNITDNWLSTDTFNAINSIVKDLNNHKGFQRYYVNKKNKENDRLKVFIAEIQNNTSEAYFPVQDLHDEFLNTLSDSGKFIILDNSAREVILKEIRYQNDGMVDENDIKKIGKQYGADALIFININMKSEINANKVLKEYSINLRLTDIESGIEIARTRYKISKYSERSNNRW